MKNYQALTDQYNVVYKTPGKSDRSAMPLGNGRVGISLWVEQDGALQFYISHTDAQSEMDRNLKLGKVILALNPNPFTSDGTFSQELLLREGCIQIIAQNKENRVRIKAFVDSASDTIFLSISSQIPVSSHVRFLSWRTADKAPWEIPVWGDEGFIVESPDVVESRQTGLLFYHKNNDRTLVRTTAHIEGLADYMTAIVDTLANRTFGGYLTLQGGITQQSEPEINCGPRKRHDLRVSVFCEQEPDTQALIEKVIHAHVLLPKMGEAARGTARYWDHYFGQSYLFVSGDQEITARVNTEILSVCLEPDDVRPAHSKITQAYILTRFMIACSGSGEMPLAFNGLIFNLMPGQNRHLTFDTFCQTFAAQPAGQPNLEINPDEKGWEECCTLWQNVRLPYASMLARGETEPIRRLFAYYRKFWAINRVKANAYYQAEGQYNTEITHSFGLMPARIYGIDRTGLEEGYAVNRWGGAIDISPGLELCFFMLDYYLFTADTQFLQEELLTYAEDLFRYIETRFTGRADEKIVLSNLQSVETYWNTTNPVTVVAGMQAVLNGILALPADLIPNRPFFERLKALTPAMPMTNDETGNPILAPAQVFDSQRHNVENPALYAVFPFRLYGVGKPDMQLMKDTFNQCMAISNCFQPSVLGNPPGSPSYSGWQYIGMAAALLGMADKAAEILANNCALKNPGCRFPAMWGPIHDAVPDGDHGGNILTTLQLMAFQVEGDQILLLPSWPKDWDVSFKLHAPQNTTVECVYTNGRITHLAVNPPERRKDVVCTAQIEIDG